MHPRLIACVSGYPYDDFKTRTAVVCRTQISICSMSSYITYSVLGGDNMRVTDLGQRYAPPDRA